MTLRIKMHAPKLNWAGWAEIEIEEKKKEREKKRQKGIGIAFKDIRNGRIKGSIANFFVHSFRKFWL